MNYFNIGDTAWWIDYKKGDLCIRSGRVYKLELTSVWLRQKVFVFVWPYEFQVDKDYVYHSKSEAINHAIVRLEMLRND